MKKFLMTVLSFVCLLSVFFVMVPVASADISLTPTSTSAFYTLVNAQDVPTQSINGWGSSGSNGRYYWSIYNPSSPNYSSRYYTFGLSTAFTTPFSDNTLYSGSFTYNFKNSNYLVATSFLTGTTLSSLDMRFYLSDSAYLNNSSHIFELLPNVSFDVSYVSESRSNGNYSFTLSFQFYISDLIATDFTPSYLQIYLLTDSIIDYTSLGSSNWGFMRYWISGFSISSDNTAPNPWPPEPEEPDSWVGGFSGKDFFGYKHSSSTYFDREDSPTPSNPTVVFSNVVYDTIDGFFLGGVCYDRNSVIEDGEPVITDTLYEFPDGQSFKGYINGMFSLVEPQEASYYDFSRVILRPYISRSSDLTSSYAQPLDLTTIIDFDNFWMTTDWSYVSGDPNQLRYFECTFYFKLPPGFNRLYNDGYCVIGLYLDFSQALVLSSPGVDQYHVDCSMTDWNFSVGYKSPVPNPQDSPTNGTIHDILDQYIQSRLPGGYISAYGLSDLQSDLLSTSSGGLLAFNDFLDSLTIDQGLLDPFRFVKSLIGLYENSFLRSVLIASLGFGLIGFVLNILPSFIRRV